MAKQDQAASEGSTAIQAGGDVTVHSGMSAQQMGEIMIALAGQLHIYLSDAEKRAEDRLLKFREDILKEFTHAERANPEAFKDPDFQYLLRDAQAAFARSGDEDVGSTLVSLLAQRSLQTGGSRISLILNQATETVSKLTKEELAVLSVSFVTLYTGGGAGNYDGFIMRFRNLIKPFLSDLPTSSTPYDYLASLGCVSLGQLVTRDLGSVWAGNYGGLFSDGFSKEDFDAGISDPIRREHLSSLLMNCLNDSSKLQLNAANEDQLRQILGVLQASNGETDHITSLFSKNIWAPERISSRIEADVPEYRRFAEVWKTSPLQSLTLTALGMTLGHSNVMRVYPDFGAELSIWIT